MKKKTTTTRQTHFWDIIVNPKRYFTKIVADGNLDESMFKAFIYGLIGGCLVLGIRLLGGLLLLMMMRKSKLEWYSMQVYGFGRTGWRTGM